MEAVVELFEELFSDWVGILSFGTIAVVILIAIFFIIFFMGRSGDPKA